MNPQAGGPSLGALGRDESAQQNEIIGVAFEQSAVDFHHRGKRGSGVDARHRSGERAATGTS